MSDFSTDLYPKLITRPSPYTADYALKSAELSMSDYRQASQQFERQAQMASATSPGLVVHTTPLTRTPIQTVTPTRVDELRRQYLELRQQHEEIYESGRQRLDDLRNQLGFTPRFTPQSSKLSSSAISASEMPPSSFTPPAPADSSESAMRSTPFSERLASYGSASRTDTATTAPAVTAPPPVKDYAQRFLQQLPPSASRQPQQSQQPQTDDERERGRDLAVRYTSPDRVAPVVGGTGLSLSSLPPVAFFSQVMATGGYAQQQAHADAQAPAASQDRTERRILSPRSARLQQAAAAAMTSGRAPDELLAALVDMQRRVRPLSFVENVAHAMFCFVV